MVFNGSQSKQKKVLGGTLWCSVPPVRIKFLIDDTIPGEINSIPRDKSRIQNDLTTGEEK